MKNSFIIACGLVLSAALSTAYSAPDECRGNRREYRRQVMERVHELKRAWRHQYNKDCSLQVDFERVYGKFLPVQGDEARRCKVLAENKGTELMIEAIAKQCSKQGEKFGSEDGRLHGQEYCANDVTSSFFSVGDFEIKYSESCKRGFIDYVNQTCPQKKAGDGGFFTTVETKCSLGE